MAAPESKKRRIREIRADYAVTNTKIPTRAFSAKALYLEVIRLSTSTINLNGTTSAYTNNLVNQTASTIMVSPRTDFHLIAGSPAIGAGTATNAPATDFEGVTQPPIRYVGRRDDRSVDGHLHRVIACRFVRGFGRATPLENS